MYIEGRIKECFERIYESMYVIPIIIILKKNFLQKSASEIFSFSLQQPSGCLDTTFESYSLTQLMIINL